MATQCLAVTAVRKAGRRGAGDLLQDPSGPRQEDGTSSGGTSRSGFRGLVPSGASEEGPLLIRSAAPARDGGDAADRDFELRRDC